MANVVSQAFHLPPYIGAIDVNNATASVVVARIGLFVENMSAVSQGFTFWALMVACITVVSLCCIVSFFALLITRYRAKKRDDNAFAQSQPLWKPLGAIFGFGVCIALYVYYCVHMYRLDELYETSEMQRTVWLGGLTFYPLWVFIYAMLIRINSQEAYRRKLHHTHSLMGKIANVFLMFISRLLVPVIVLISTGFPLHISQAKSDAATQKTVDYLTNLEYLLADWAANSTATNVVPVVRRVENDAISIWHDTASAYDSMQPIYLVWTVYFALTALACVGTMIYVGAIPKRRSMRGHDDQQHVTLAQCWTIYCSLFLSLAVTFYLLFCTVRLPHYSSYAIVPTFLAILLAMVSVTYMLAGAAFLLVMALSLRAKPQIERDLQSPSPPPQAIHHLQEDTKTSEHVVGSKADGYPIRDDELKQAV